jgi:RNA polymerase sigma-70 factor, ECF subfamily
MSSIGETTSPSDLVDRIRRGNKEAENVLVQRYSRGVSFVIREMTQSVSDVEELAQQTFMLAIEKIRQGAVREPERLSGYICGIARKLAWVHLKKTRLRNLTAIDEIELVVDSNSGPFEQLLRKEEAEIVRQVIKELRVPRDREIITRHYLHDEDRKSICASLSLTNVQFNRVIFRALDRFKELYEKRLSLLAAKTHDR